MIAERLTEGVVEGAPTEVCVFGAWVPVDDWWLEDDVPVFVTRMGTLKGVPPRHRVRWTVRPGGLVLATGDDLPRR